MSDIPEITSEFESEGFCDLVLRAVSHATGPDGSQTIAARGTHNGRPVGFNVMILPEWEPWDVESLGTLYRGGVLIQADGEQSHAFLRALDELYGTREASDRMAERVFFAAVALAGHPPSLRENPVMIKLFFEADAPDRYAEVYLNIDLDRARVEFHEKDPDYRRPLVLALSAAAPTRREIDRAFS